MQHFSKTINDFILNYLGAFQIICAFQNVLICSLGTFQVFCLAHDNMQLKILSVHYVLFSPNY